MYKDIFKQIISKQKFLFDKVINNDFSNVDYKEEHSKEWGQFDKNYINRLRLTYYILFNKIDNEQLILRLFEQELIERQTNSFQGIGSCLEILTYLLIRYNINQKYDNLFNQAKNANFDCFCGYNTDYQISPNIDDNYYDIQECINIAVELKYTKEASQLIDEWKSSITIWNDNLYNNLIHYNNYTNQKEQNEEPLKILLNNKILLKDNFAIISAYNSLIKNYIDTIQFEKAYYEFNNMLNNSNIDIKEIYNMNLFNSLIENALDIIADNPDKFKSLWTWSKPFIVEKMNNRNNMYGNLYIKSINISKTMNDDIYRKLLTEYDLWCKEVGINKRL